MNSGIEDLMNVEIPNMNNISIENEEIIEGTLTDDLSFLYNKQEDKYYIHGFDFIEYDEYDIEIGDDFEEMNIDGFVVTKEMFDRFKEIVLKN